MNNIQRDPFLTQYVPLLLAVLPGCMVILQLLGVPFINTPDAGIGASLLLFLLAVVVSKQHAKRLAAWCFPSLGVIAFEVVRWQSLLMDYYREFAHTLHDTALSIVPAAIVLVLYVIAFIIWPIILGVSTWKVHVHWPATALLLLAFVLTSGILYNLHDLLDVFWLAWDVIPLVFLLTPPLLCLRWIATDGAAAAILVIAFVPAWLELLLGPMTYTDATQSTHTPAGIANIALLLITCVVFLVVLPFFMLTFVPEQRMRRLLKWIPPLIVLLSILMVFTSLLGVEPERLTYLFSIQTIVKIVRMTIPMYIVTAIYDQSPRMYAGFGRERPAVKTAG